MTCDELRPEYEAFALGSAGEPERSDIAEHLGRDCPACTEGVAAALSTVAAMASFAKPANPPRALRRRVIAMIDPSAARSRFAVWLPWAVALTLAIAMASIIVPARRESAVGSRLAEAFTILNDPAAKDVAFGEPAKPARGRIFLSPRRGIVLIAANLPSIPSGRTFQMWVIPQSGAPIPAGTFRAGAQGSVVYVRSGPVPPAAAAVAVTIEPAGGSPQPTTTPFIVSRL